jgi:hypothetical protein
MLVVKERRELVLLTRVTFQEVMGDDLIAGTEELIDRKVIAFLSESRSRRSSSLRASAWLIPRAGTTSRSPRPEVGATRQPATKAAAPPPSPARGGALLPAASRHARLGGA